MPDLVYGAAPAMMLIAAAKTTIPVVRTLIQPVGVATFPINDFADKAVSTLHENVEYFPKCTGTPFRLGKSFGSSGAFIFGTLRAFQDAHLIVKPGIKSLTWKPESRTVITFTTRSMCNQLRRVHALTDQNSPTCGLVRHISDNPLIIVPALPQ